MGNKCLTTTLNKIKRDRSGYSFRKCMSRSNPIDIFTVSGKVNNTCLTSKQRDSNFSSIPHSRANAITRSLKTFIALPPDGSYQFISINKLFQGSRNHQDRQELLVRTKRNDNCKLTLCSTTLIHWNSGSQPPGLVGYLTGSFNCFRSFKIHLIFVMN